jgi:uncharacterized protein (TIGR04255 family)
MRCVVKLNHPPLSQTWIGFTFEPSDQKRPWDLGTASEFLDRFSEALPKGQAFFETQIEIQDISLARRPRVVGRETKLDKARVESEDGTHWLQLADDRMTYNRTRGEGVYLGYESLRDEALAKLSDYVAFFRPPSLRAVELHYVDLIEIPIPPEEKIDLADYFKLRVEIPDEYGPTWHFSTRLFLKPPIDGDILEVRFQSEVPNSELESYRFRIDWHMSCSGIGEFKNDAVRQRLDQAHDCLTSYFKASVTERTWALFQPSDEG